MAMLIIYVLRILLVCLILRERPQTQPIELNGNALVLYVLCILLATLILRKTAHTEPIELIAEWQC